MVTKDMSITEILQKYPETINVFSKYNLGCVGCFAASFESLEAGLTAHGIEVDTFLNELNEFINKNS